MIRFYMTMVSIFVLTSLLTGCASLISGRTQVVRVTSEPPNAEVVLDSKAVGRTPCDVTLNRKAEHKMVLRTDSGNTQEMMLTKGMNYWVLLDVLGFPCYFLPGIIGAGYDVHTGAAYEYVSITPAAKALKSTEINEGH